MHDDIPESELTPIDKSVAPAIRDELRALSAQLQSVSRAIGPMADGLAERMSRLLSAQSDRLLAEIAKGRKEDREYLDGEFARVDAALDALADESAARALDVKRLDERIDALSLSTGAALQASDEDVTKVTKLAHATERDLRVFTRGRVGFAFAAVGLTHIAKSEVTWGDVRAWAWSHWLSLIVVTVVLATGIAVEIHVRWKAQKGKP